MDVQKINKQLSNSTAKWYAELKNKDPKYSNENEYSAPFCLGLSEKEFERPTKTIMIVGEESNNNFLGTTTTYDQTWFIRYFDRQIHKLNQNEFKSSNRGQFWNFIRKLRKQTQYNICWNNIDKLHGVFINKNGDKTTYKLQNTGENLKPHTLVNWENGVESTLLQREIEIVKPDVIIFYGAPYAETISKGLGLEDTLTNLPSLKNNEDVVTTIEDIPYLNNTLVLWTSHPMALVKAKCGSLYHNALESITEKIKEKFPEDFKKRAN